MVVSICGVGIHWLNLFTLMVLTLRFCGFLLWLVFSLVGGWLVGFQFYLCGALLCLGWKVWFTLWVGGL